MALFLFLGWGPKIRSFGIISTPGYNLLDLKHACVEALTASLTVENALDLLVMADMHHCDDLKDAAKKLIVQKSGEVVEQEGWFKKIAKFHDLLEEVFKAVAKK